MADFLNNKLYTVVWLLILCFGVTLCRNSNRREERATRCNKIVDFYNGDVVYFDNREVGTEVYYSCDEDFTQVPEDTELSICTQTASGQKWVPEPPKCFGMATVQVPHHGYSDIVDKELPHGESYNVSCHYGFELYSRKQGYLDTEFETITSYNGTLTPTLPRCVPARCDPESMNETVISHPNGTMITDLIPSGTSLMFSCIDGYEFRHKVHGLNVTRRTGCKNGEFQRVPKCKEKMCVIGNVARNEFTSIQYYQNYYSLLFPGFEIEQYSELVVNCRDYDDYELYVNSTGQFLDDFMTVCVNGEFTVAAEEFPICLEKRCHFKNQPLEFCFWKNGTSRDDCYHGDFYVPSRTTVNIRCSDGYMAVGGSNVETPTSDCLFGKYTPWTPINCKPLPCEVPAISYESAIPKWRHRVESSTNVTFACDEGHRFMETPFGTTLQSTCSLGNWTTAVPHCEPAPCKIPRIENGHTNYTSDVKSSTRVTFVCKHGYHIATELSRTMFESMCHLGRWRSTLYQCKPDPCDIPNINNGKALNIPRRVRRVQSSKKVTFQCNAGYRFTVEPFGTRLQSTCFLGNWTTAVPHCEPAPCEVPPIENGSANLTLSVVKSSTTVTFVCKHGYHIPMDSSRKYESTCYLGIWRSPIHQCKPDPCDVPIINNGYPLNISRRVRRVQSSKKVIFKCKDEYRFTEEPFGTTLQSTCFLGNWTTTVPHCEPAPCEVPTVENGSTNLTLSVVKSSTTVIFYCYPGHHVLMVPYRTTSKSKCYFGDWTPKIHKCKPDPCKIPAFENGVVNVTDVEVDSSTHVNFSCKDGYQFKELKTTSFVTECLVGNWTQEIPFCEPVPCKVPTMDNGEAANVTSNVVKSATQVTFTCYDGYHILMEPYTKMLESMCSLGIWSPTIHDCKPDPCEVPYINNGAANITDTSVDNSTEVEFVCDAGHKFTDLNTTILVSTCAVGQWAPTVPDCDPAPCILPEANYGAFNLTTNIVENATNVACMCNAGYHISEEPYNNVSESTCVLGRWLPSFQSCQPDSCYINVTDDKIYKENGVKLITATSGLLPNGTVLSIQCEEGYHVVDHHGNAKDLPICVLGKWTRPEMLSSVCQKYCIIPSDGIFSYENAESYFLSPGDEVAENETLTVTCAEVTIDYYYDTDDSNATITCINGSFTEPDLKCPEKEETIDMPDTCLNLENGNVTYENNFGKIIYSVRCHTAYKLNTTSGERCKCLNGTLNCMGQKPGCIPDGCVIPPDDNYVAHSTRVEVDGVTYQAGLTVAHGQSAVLSCHQDDDKVYEPNNTTYACQLGKWIRESSVSGETTQRDVSNNTGAFPKCEQILRNCTISKSRLEGGPFVKNISNTNNGSSKNITIQHKERIKIQCGLDVDLQYTCLDGQWQSQGHKFDVNYDLTCTVAVFRQYFLAVQQTLKSILSAFGFFREVKGR